MQSGPDILVFCLSPTDSTEDGWVKRRCWAGRSQGKEYEINFTLQNALKPWEEMQIWNPIFCSFSFSSGAGLPGNICGNSCHCYLAFQTKWVFWFQYLRPIWDNIDSDFLIKWNCLLDIGKDLLIQLKFYFSHFFLQILLFTTQQVYYLLFYKYVIYPSINLLVTSSWFQITSTHSWILLM